MKIIKFSETVEQKNSDKCIAKEYCHCDKDIDIATAEINGRYPDKGYCVNLKVKEMIYVISGSGQICKENETINFIAGDAILINAGEKYYWNAVCKVAMCCAPAWYAEQHILME